ncbi:MAG: hypothetical protein C0P78_006150, partial [Bacillota bacterium]
MNVENRFHTSFPREGSELAAGTIEKCRSAPPTGPQYGTSRGEHALGVQTLQRMQYRTSLVKIVAAVTCALLVLAACGQSQNTGQTSDASQTPSTSSGEDAAAIVVVQAAPFDTLDPGYAESGDDL